MRYVVWGTVVVGRVGVGVGVDVSVCELVEVGVWGAEEDGAMLVVLLTTLGGHGGAYGVGRDSSGADGGGRGSGSRGIEGVLRRRR